MTPSRACLECGEIFKPRLHGQRRCLKHERRGREDRSPTTRAQNAEYARERRRILASNPRCAYCPAPATTVDHVVAVANGGRHAGNLVPCCESCNARKQARSDWPPPDV